MEIKGMGGALYTQNGRKLADIEEVSAMTVDELYKQRSKTTTYTIKSGDTLSRIAQKKLGKASRYPEIYKLNKSKIEAAAKKHGRKSSNNGHWIYPGTKLTIPKK